MCNQVHLLLILLDCAKYNKTRIWFSLWNAYWGDLNCTICAGIYLFLSFFGRYSARFICIYFDLLFNPINSRDFYRVKWSAMQKNHNYRLLRMTVINHYNQPVAWCIFSLLCVCFFVQCCFLLRRRLLLVIRFTFISARILVI